jgi:rhodanese-related sulfurtransferase
MAEFKQMAFRIFRQAGITLFLAVTLGILVNQARSNRLPLVADWSPESRLTTESGESLVISLEDARKVFYSKKAMFLDARSSDAFREGHIQGAKNLPWQSFDEYVDRVIEEIPLDALVIAYCDGEHCELSEDLAQELLLMGYENVLVLINGWTRLMEAGLPVEKGLEGPSGIKKAE